MKEYFVKYLPEKSINKDSQQVFLHGEAYQNMRSLCNKRPDGYTFIMRDGDAYGQHVRWENLSEGNVREDQQKVFYRGEVYTSIARPKSKRSSEHTYISKDNGFGSSGKWVKTKELKIAKSHLCSYKIKSGDVVYNDNHLHSTLVVNLRDFLRTEPTISKSYKIIGEISEGAIWVEGGDEFDKEDLAFRYKGEYLFYQKFVDIVYFSAGIDLCQKGLATIGVKCPTCKTFH